ncbi:class I SAM-dependent methyltransferase [Desulfolutivibrio sulfoxidireducens]|uniref:class I SAM-dependent methyltransferase n=1 Tax=Desulfolutivibrio sulfoxidireducens TaxID=2773299 RepID=UPI00159E8F6F|nr:class I SAM-dependent methyltransferase [Desulfolutivibrio sulfoxidireducens]QLA20290.1 methyltransferase domain-containing protein [Desulfolutivibrio sulfoxidireducens]
MIKTLSSRIGGLGVRLRNVLSRRMFSCVETCFSGVVLDVGGGSFYRYVRTRMPAVTRWITLDPDATGLTKDDDQRHVNLVGDGCNLCFGDATFDAVLNSQVLEHVMEPLRMVAEVARVLKPGGYAIFLVPQTACVHLIPHCYGNFTIYWIRRALRENNLSIVEEAALGGFWRTILFRFLYFFCEAFRLPGFSDAGITRNRCFYALFPLMVLYILVSMPILLLLQLGDLKEEPNNHLVVARKDAPPMETRTPGVGRTSGTRNR